MWPFARRKPKLKSLEPSVLGEIHPLPLLNLTFGAVQIVRELTIAASRWTHEPDAEIAEMLEGPNWRWHLIAAIACLTCSQGARRVPLLWGTMRRGTWVSPQIAATLSLLDVDFDEHARAFAESYVDREDSQNDVKGFAAVLALLDGRPTSERWLGAMVTRREVQAILGSDEDSGGDRSRKWLSRLPKVFDEAQVSLPG